METPRERIIRLIREMQNRTTDRGATPAEAAAFAGKVAEWVERYQIEEAELRSSGDRPEQLEVCQEYYWTDKQVHNPGVTQLISGLAGGMSCKIILLNRRDQGVFRQTGYGVIGTPVDAQFVVQMVPHLLPQLVTMAKMEGMEHGYEKAGLVRWCNQYLGGAGEEIMKRLLRDRKSRSEQKEALNRTNALVCITGDKLAVLKTTAVAARFKEFYPRTESVKSRAEYDGTARERGKDAGASIGLGLPVTGSGRKRLGGA